MDRVKVLVNLYNLALRGRYEVTPEGAAQMDSILKAASMEIQAMTKEIQDDIGSDSDEG